ncbi:MAG: cation-transporting P-type ATPase [Acidimicrobiales bacterium]|nr:cation-transporting P-type ATPase [Acidimicrobiales bacterium]
METAAGLTSAEAAERLRRDGPNVLPPPARRSPWKELAHQLVHFFALMLWVAAGLAFVAGMPQLGVAIAVVVVVNGTFAFIQESRAERAAEKLADLLPRRALVRRDGVPVEVDAAALVLGDVVLLTAGDRVSADLRTVEAHALLLDTSLLTGESAAVPVDVGERVHGGTFVVEGDAVAEVVATGARTRLAGIAALTRATHRPRSPLAIELDRVVRTIAAIAVAVGGAFFAVAVLNGTSPSDGFLFAIGVTVALVPEGLLPTVTLSLARGAQGMAHHHALVRRLEAVETLGSTTFVCTDKTGTLTRNQMSVVSVWTPAGSVLVSGNGYEPDGEVSGPTEALDRARRAALAGVRSSTGRAVLLDGAWVAQGDPMEAAIDVLARRLGVDVAADERARPSGRRFPFDPRRRRMSVVVGADLLVKGAPDTVMARCANGQQASDAADELAASGLRVIAVARRSAAGLVPADPGGLTDPAAAADLAERDLELLALLGLEDPPRTEAREALAACRRAGIRVAMVTGDHPATARAIAREVGLLPDHDGLVLEGVDLPDDLQVLGALLDRDGVVVSRVDPEDKLRIARALQERGHVVAMTGDGVNDGPALQEADIGVAMGRSGTDVAREAADLVLLDDDFATIVAAIEQGRATFSNVRRFLTYHLTDNVAELTPFVVWALSGARFPLAIGVLQVLCLDIGTDLLPALALGAEPPTAWALRQPPLHRHLIDRRILFRVFGVLGPTEAVMEMAAFMVGMAAAGWRPGGAFPEGEALLAASGAAFSAVVIGQCANAFACRSTVRPPWQLGWLSNPLVIYAVLTSLAALVGFLFIGPVADVLGQAPPPLAGAVVAVAAAPAVLAADAVHKVAVRRRLQRESPGEPPDGE